ncbi:MAG: hypothetical protein COV48_09855 [Elusimicrobia bacterium CG11_big_fil_rev_8_21_14_0_20_64_6]|nr:MAG: hypothetical protein COV48_09855 [Elusimicrobia bacterium CG11_big_fil_rev_8_21_14_0_20_64_6]
MNKKFLKNGLLFIVLIIAASPAAARRPKNFRLRWKKHPAAEGTVASTAAARGPLRVMPGRWTPAVRAALDGFLAERGKDSPGYDASKPPVAVLPWSDALVTGDPAELVFLRMTTDVDFRFQDEWWEIIPVASGRQPARAAYNHFISLSSAVWQSQPDYHHYRKEVLNSYIGLCREVGRRECRQYLMRLWAGWSEDQAVEYSIRVLAAEKERPSGTEMVYAEEGDKTPLRVRRGLAVVSEMRDLVKKLLASGVDVWIVDDVPQPVLLAATIDYEIDPSRVYGIRAVPEGKRYSAAVLKPVPTRGGKAEAVKASLGRPPDLVFARDAADIELMSYGRGLRIILTGDKDLEAKAREMGWMKQPTLAR